MILPMGRMLQEKEIIKLRHRVGHAVKVLIKHDFKLCTSSFSSVVRKE